MANQGNENVARTSSPKIEIGEFIENEPPEVTEAKAVARRYRLPYIDLLPPDKTSPIDYEELAGIPVDLMLRNQFVPQSVKAVICTRRCQIPRILRPSANWKMR